MDMNHALHFLTSHNALIIQWLLAFICGLSIILIFRVVVRKKSDNDDMKVPDLTNIESSLKKIIEGSMTSKPAAADGVVAADPNMVADLQNLKNAVAEKTAEIEKLKAAASASGAGDSGLADKIKDLEAKLAEYQILEDDIADLTRYKKENEELKAKLTGEAPVASEAPAAAAAAPTPAEEPTPAPTPVASAEVAAAPAAPAEPAAPAPTAASPAPGPDLVAEFQATVQEQKKAEGNDLLAEFSTDQKSS